MGIDTAKYIIYNENMRSYGFGDHGQVIVKNINEATKYETFGQAMKVAVKYMEFYENSKFKVISFFENSPQNEVIGIFVEGECLFVTPYKKIIDKYIDENKKLQKECKFSVKKIPYIVD